MKNAKTAPPRIAKPKNISLSGITINNGMLCLPLAQLGRLATAHMGTGGAANATTKRKGRPPGVAKKSATA